MSVRVGWLFCLWSLFMFGSLLINDFAWFFLSPVFLPFGPWIFAMMLWDMKVQPSALNSFRRVHRSNDLAHTRVSTCPCRFMITLSHTINSLSPKEGTLDLEAGQRKICCNVWHFCCGTSFKAKLCAAGINQLDHQKAASKLNLLKSQFALNVLTFDNEINK